MKLDPTKRDWDQAFYWVAHPDALTESHYRNLPEKDSVEGALVASRYDIDIIGGVEDKDADYSFDDWALCRLDGQYYMLSASGCSCPSPSETWGVEIGPATLDEVKEHILSGAYDGNTVPRKQEDEFLALIESARSSEASPSLDR